MPHYVCNYRLFFLFQHEYIIILVFYNTTRYNGGVIHCKKFLNHSIYLMESKPGPN
ncbi:hypothetical protein DOZ91_01065 [Peribacillus frigoritolerans]|nr:hypothetical protein DOZ91_01065 [Peribacillus frigoritolerans]